jgi:hypothetical protein
MTEYDYSEEAYQRYVATLQRISNWRTDSENASDLTVRVTTGYPSRREFERGE